MKRTARYAFALVLGSRWPKPETPTITPTPKEYAPQIDRKSVHVQIRKSHQQHRHAHRQRRVV